jgi:hypothetical protein
VAKLAPQPAAKLVSVFRRFGFTPCKRGADGHIRMQKPGVIRPIVFSDKREVPVFVILNNLRTGKISREDYLHALAQV